MGNGTTCNLQLVKQNAKKKGEVSTGLFSLFLLHFGAVGFIFFTHNSLSLHKHYPFLPVDHHCTASSNPLLSSINSYQQACRDVLASSRGGGPVAKDELKTWDKGGAVLGQRGPDLWRQTTRTTTGEGGEETTWHGMHKFIYHNSTIALPIPDSQCKCWTFREKITSPGEWADGEKLSRLQ